MVLDRAALGFSPDGHALIHLRPRFSRPLPRAVDLTRIPDGSMVEVAGQFEMRQQPATAHGMRFVLLSDETGLINLVLTPQVYARYRPVIRGEMFQWVRGQLERHGGSISIKVAWIRPLARLLQAHPERSGR